MSSRTTLLNSLVSTGTRATDALSLGRIPTGAKYLAFQAKFIGGPTVASAYSLTANVTNPGTSVVKVTIVDTTPSITSGKVRIVGLVGGVSTTEDLNISAGAGTYLSTTVFDTITAVYTWGVAVLGGAGNETILVEWNSNGADIVLVTNLVEPSATFDIFVQTTLDEGTTWCDVANYRFTTFNAVRIHAVKLNTALAPNVTPTDGGIGANQILSGLIGNKIRLKTVTSNEYVGARITIDVAVR
jgi:hypothetical protein